MIQHKKSHYHMYAISTVNPDLWSRVPILEEWYRFELPQVIGTDWIMKPESIKDARPLVPKPLIQAILISPLIRWMAKALIGGQK